MKINPLSDIAIGGVHCPRGVDVDVPDRIARELIAQRLVVRSREIAKIETAEVAPVAETTEAVRQPVRRMPAKVTK